MTAADLKSAALAYYQRGSFAEATQAFDGASTAYRAEGDPAMAAEMLSNRGVALRGLRDYPQAITVLETAIVEFRALNDNQRLAFALGNLGSVFLENNEHARAANSLNEALTLLDPKADKQARSETLRVLGEVRLKQGKYVEGMVDYEAGLRDVENPSAQQSWLKKLLDKPLKMMGRK